MFAEDRIVWSEKWIAQGRAQGLEKGRAEGRAETLSLTRDMLVEAVQARFGGPLANRARSWLEKISDARTLHELGKWLLACENPEVLLERLESV